MLKRRQGKIREAECRWMGKAMRCWSLPGMTGVVKSRAVRWRREDRPLGGGPRCERLSSRRDQAMW